ncbi:MAG: type IX secretion system membrane protein PorP/SprF [Marinifilaceae bacterium]
MKKLFFFIAFLLPFSGVKAQQDPQFSQNMFNRIAINPAAAGMEKGICASAINRQQWVGFDNAPVTTVFNVDAPVKFGNREHGLGLTIISDKLGFEKNNNLHFSYSFHKKLGKGSLNFGLQLGIQNNALKGQWIPPEENSDDPLLSGGQIDESQLVFDSGLGIFYQQNNFYLGASVTHLNQSTVKYGTSMEIYLARHYYVMGGYTLQISEPWEIVPSLFYKTDGKISQIDINSNIVYNKKFWGGVSYRIEDAIVTMLGIQLKNGLRFGYAYDISTSKIAKGSHEFLLAYCFTPRLEKKKQRYKSVRFL